MCFAFEVTVVRRLLNGRMLGVCFGRFFVAISLGIMDLKLSSV